MSGEVSYRAMEPCRIGGAYRRAGEVFSLPELDDTPPFLVRMESEPDEPPARPAPSRRPRAAAPGPMPSDLPGVERD